MSGLNQHHYFAASLLFHGIVLFFLIFGFDSIVPLPVFVNTNKNDVISAVVLGDSPHSRILPQHPTKVEVQPEKQEIIKPVTAPRPQSAQQERIKTNVIALKIEKQKHAEKKAAEEKKRRELFAKDLLADIKQQANKPVRIKQKQLKSQFEKTLREQAEMSLREELLNDEIKLKGIQTRQAHGEVNKYKALILQAISAHWIVPVDANKHLYSELLIRVAPGGLVLDVQVTRSSGDYALDSSARAAVFKASPLPVPKDQSLFEPFRQFILKVKPENILTENGSIGNS